MDTELDSVKATDVLPLALASFHTDKNERLRLIRQALPDYETAISHVERYLNKREASYRRGYHHAFSFVMDILGGKVSEEVAELLNLHYQVTSKWRENLENRVPPPPSYWEEDPEEEELEE